MEKALLVLIEVNNALRKQQEAADQALSELNQHLAEGWRVKDMRPTSGTATQMASFCLVILSRDETPY